MCQKKPTEYKHKYHVYIYEQPYHYVVKADNESQAEYFAMTKFNDCNYEDVSKIEVRKERK